ncbi:MotE family protein [Roseobacteraceae bacterium S113]
MFLKTKVAKPKRQQRRNALAAIASILIVSAVLRLGDYASEAVANQPSEISTKETQETLPSERERIQIVLDALSQREKQLEQREEQVELRIDAMRKAESELEQRINELTNMENKLRETIALAEVAAEDDLSRLTAVYENMKPKESAELFETMDPSFAAGFLGRMKPAAAAGIMAGLEPETAYAISVVLAGRNANAPTE